MTDIALIPPPIASAGGDFVSDIGLLNADLATDGGMDTAIIISLFTDARADDDDALPQDGADRRGWWADAYADVAGDVTGSKLWLLAREKQLPAVLTRAQGYAQDALAWMISDGVASAIDVVASFPAQFQIGLAITVTRPTGPNRQHFDYVWSQAT